MHKATVLGALLSLVRFGFASRNSTYTNPTIPGWHSDPSCIFVPEKDNTFFCATSTFLLTPGIPVHASKDLIDWKLASHAASRPSQLPYMCSTIDQNDGIFAPTLRYHNGTFYIATVFVFRQGGGGVTGLIFKTTDPFDDAAWSEPLVYNASHIDPDLFWDDDGTVYLTSAGMYQGTIDLESGAQSPQVNIWNGTGGLYPEGPHVYKKDGYYYLMISEGGTELGHRVTIARSKDIAGPYESYAGNPILTNSNTTEYFQTVGHADLFQDAAGDWWAMALSTRSGPAWNSYPMGRETVLTPVAWKEGQWPVFEPVRGRMEGWHLPKPTRDLPGVGPFINEPDVIDFRPGSSIPAHLSYWRWPKNDTFQVSPQGHPNTLRIKPSKYITSASNESTGVDGISLIMRLQTNTYFHYSVDVDFQPKHAEEEAGVTVFLTQAQHLDLGIVLLPSANELAKPVPHLRFRTTGRGQLQGDLPEPVIKPIPMSWLKGPISLQIDAKNDTHYTFSAAHSGSQKSLVLGDAPATIVSGDTGPFTGSLVGAYATTNGGNGNTEAYISKWRYCGKGQKIEN